MDRREYLHDRARELAQDRSAFGAGLRRVPVRIASVRFDLLTPDPALEARLTRYFSPYLAEGPADAELRLETLSPPPGIPDLWEDEDAEFRAQGPVMIQRDFAGLRVDSPFPGAPERAVALLPGHLDDAFHNLLRWFAPRLLLSHRCFLLHGAGAVRDGRGYVFFGQSGAGKSTSMSLVRSSDPEAVILGDDAVIIQIDSAGIPVLHSAPLGCGYSAAAPEALTAPLSGIYQLRQLNENRIESLAPSQGVAALLASAMNTSPDDHLTERFDLALRFAESACGIRALNFRREPAFWPLVLAAGAQSKHYGRTHAPTELPDRSSELER